MSENNTRKNYKCPCCNNPWAQATGEFFAKLCVECEPAEEKEKDASDVMGIDRANMDPAMLPSQNFYQYSNGTWLKKNPIPSGYPNWYVLYVLYSCMFIRRPPKGFV